MKRTLTALTAFVFATSFALPAFAQISESDTPSVTTSSSVRESTRSDYQSEQPAPAVERTERSYHSERTTESEAPVMPEVQQRVEKKVTTRTTTEAVPPPPVDQTTTTTTRRTTTGY